MSAQLIESSPVEPLVVGVHLYPGDTWFREVHVRSVTTQAPVDLSGWVFEARLGEHVGVVDVSRAAEGRLAVTFRPEQTADAVWGDVLTLSGVLAGGRRTFLHGAVGAAVGSSIPVGLAQKTRVVSSDVDISMYAAPRGDKGEDGSAVSVALVQRAETAEGRAVSAAGVASDAAGSAGAAASAAAASAGSASASAGAAASSATTALGAAAGIVAARDAAAASSAKANADADRAGVSAFNAAASAAAAQGSENAAGTARTAAETARTGAESAKAGADTAKAGAEAARDLALAGQFAGSSLGTVDLNTVTTPGAYWQNTTTNATAARNYPVEGSNGILDVRRVSTSSAVVQRYEPHNGNASLGARVFYERSQSGTTWTAWRAYASQRVNAPAGQPGVEVFTWDDVSAREQQLTPLNMLLGTVSLDAVTAPGQYYNAAFTDATTARGYPVADVIGHLEVLREGAFTTIQRFTIRTASNGAVFSGAARGLYQRRYSGGAWGPWWFIAGQRVDQTAGRAIYTWDDLNAREQLIYGDTGRRDITAVINAAVAGAVTGGSVYLTRFGRTVTVALNNVTVPASATAAAVIPAGFRPIMASVYAVGYSPNTATVWTNGDLNLPIGSSRYGSFAYLTDNAWPTTLPGTPDGSIPNL